MTISRRKNFVALIEDEEYEWEEERPKAYCKRCDKEFGVKALLGPRIMLLDVDGKPERRGCGSMYHKQEVKQEAKLGDFVETSDNPHEDSKSVIETLYPRTKGKRSNNRLKQKKKQEQLDSIKDEDIKSPFKPWRLLGLFDLFCCVDLSKTICII